MFFFCFAFKNIGICSVFCISGLKSSGIYSFFCVFALLPQKTLKRKSAVIYSILLLSKSQKSSEKCVKRALFSDFRYPQNGGGMLLETLMSDPDSVQKASPSRVKDFWCFSGPGVEGSAAWGALHHRALVALGPWSRRVLATFGRRNAGIYAVFLPVTVLNHCKLQHCLHFLNRFFVLVNAKNAGIYVFFKLLYFV